MFPLREFVFFYCLLMSLSIKGKKKSVSDVM